MNNNFLLFGISLSFLLSFPGAYSMEGRAQGYIERLDGTPPCVVVNTHFVTRGQDMRVDQVDWRTLHFVPLHLAKPDGPLHSASATVRIPFSCHAPFRIEMRSKEGALTNKSYRHVSVEGVSVKAPYEATLSWHPQKGTPSELVLDASGDNQSARAKSPGLAPGSGHVDLTVDIPEQGDVVLHSGVMSDRILIDFINIRSGTRSTYTVLLNESPEAYKKTNSL